MRYCWRNALRGERSANLPIRLNLDSIRRLHRNLTAEWIAVRVLLVCGRRFGWYSGWLYLFASCRLHATAVIYFYTMDYYRQISRAARKLLRLGMDKLAADVAKIALDLTQSGAVDLLRTSPTGLSIGDRVKSRTPLAKINKDTPGNVVGFTSDGKLLVLFFPQEAPAGSLSLVKEKEIVFVNKPVFAQPWGLIDEEPVAQKGPGKPSQMMPGGDHVPDAPPPPSPKIVPPPSPKAGGLKPKPGRKP